MKCSQPPPMAVTDAGTVAALPIPMKLKSPVPVVSTWEFVSDVVNEQIGTPKQSAPPGVMSNVGLLGSESAKPDALALSWRPVPSALLLRLAKVAMPELKDAVVSAAENDPPLPAIFESVTVPVAEAIGAPLPSTACTET